MTYPIGSATYPRMEILIDGVWTDYSTRVRGESGITIKRGRDNEQGRLSPQTARFVINNRDGLFSNRNPLSPLFRKIPMNTQVRFSAGSVTGETWYRMPSDFGNDIASRASTPDTATLDVTGDLELRVEVQPYSWRPRGTLILFTKYRLTGNNRSWALYMDALGRPTFAWSADGSTRLQALSTAAIPADSGKLAIKVTIDVVDGANKTVTFYTAPSIDGTYTQLGSAITTAGNTSIFAGAASVCIGQGDDNARIFSDAFPFRGRFFKARVYDGIGGAIRCNPDFTVQSIGATSFVDSNGLTWTMGGASRITSDRMRFWGELTSLPQSWDLSGKDVYADATASGLIRRLTQGASPLSSPIYRAMSGRTLTGYWPVEDGSRATSAASAVEGVLPATCTKVQFSDVLTLPGSKSAASFIDATGRFLAVPKSTVATGTAYFSFYFNLASLPVTQSKFLRLTTSGVARTILLSVSPTAFAFDFLAADGSTLDSIAYTFGGADYSPAGRWIAFNLVLTASGGNTQWVARWSNVAGETFVTTTPATFAGTTGRFVNIDLSAAASAGFVDASFAHFVTATSDLGFVSYAFARASNGYLGETAAARIARLATEENVAMEISGDAAQSEPMGYQTTDSLINLLYEAADADQGILGEARDRLALTYRTRVDLENRNDIQLSYSAKELAEVPRSVEDDYGVTNDVTVLQPNGSSGRREIESGYMSVLDPPNGIGRYQTEITLNLQTATQLRDMASWIARASSWDGPRYPNVSVGLHRSQIALNATQLYKTICVDLGDTLSLAGMPSWVPPDIAYSLIQGYTETLTKFLWTIPFNTSPAGIYKVGRYDYETTRGDTRYDLDSLLNVAVNASTTTIVLASSVAGWTTNAAMYPFNIMLGGEEIQLTTAPGSGLTQTFTNVVRSVNGISKSHAAGTAASLAKPSYYGI